MTASGVPPVDLGGLRRARPISRSFGFDRGTPVDRHFVDRFLTANAKDISGRTLEIGDDAYTARFGGERTTKREVLHVDASNPHATIVGDLADPNSIPVAAFDCAVITQTLHLLYDVPAAFATLYASLKPGGVLLATVPVVSQISEDEWAATWFWGFTPHSFERLARGAFSAAQDAVRIETYGSPAATICFLHGLAAEEVPDHILAADNPSRPGLIGVRAFKG